MPSSLLFVAVLLAQAPAKDPLPLSAAAFDEDDVAGHPDGEPPPLAKGIDWSLDKAQVASTPRRRRLSLAGPWRFAATPNKDVSPQRAEMGWLNMPAGAPAQWDISNSRRQASRGKWAGKPLSEYPYAWCERVIDTPAEWVRYQVFLVVSGPWADAELFCAYQPVLGIPREGGQWFEITESLVYGGEAPLDLRLKDPGDTTPSPTRDTPPSITLELVPTGPRFDGISVRQDPEKRELEVFFELRRPKFILGLPVRLSEIPLIVQFSYEAADGATIYRFDQNIGPMPAEHRTDSLRLPWSKGNDSPPPEKARLRARLTSVYGGNMDIAYPLEFEPKRLAKTEN
jgi:hypothetical protein